MTVASEQCVMVGVMSTISCASISSCAVSSAAVAASCSRASSDVVDSASEERYSAKGSAGEDAWWAVDGTRSSKRPVPPSLRVMVVCVARREGRSEALRMVGLALSMEPSMMTVLSYAFLSTSKAELSRGGGFIVEERSNGESVVTSSVIGLRLCGTLKAEGSHVMRELRILACLLTMAAVASSSASVIRRALLYGLAVDNVTYDLEDSVTPTKKPEARAQLRDFLNTQRPEGIREQAVRINAVDTPYALQDLTEILKAPNLDALVVPKVNSPSDLHFVTDVIRHVLPERHTSNVATQEKEPLKIIALIESAKALTDLNAICAASPYLSGLVFAAEDFALDLSLTRTPSLTEFLYARSAIVTAARAFGLPSAIDLVCTQFRGAEGESALREECEGGKRLGFNGKQLIHPSQVGTCQEVYSPAAQEVEWAVRCVIADEKADKQGRAAWTLDGKMIDVPVVGKAKGIVAKAETARRHVPQVADAATSRSWREIDSGTRSPARPTIDHEASPSNRLQRISSFATNTDNSSTRNSHSQDSQINAQPSLRTASFLVYILGMAFTDNFVLIFILTMLLLAADFYNIKNISGRRLVGLRWWNEVNAATGATTMVFESLSPDEAAQRVNATDKRFFWLALYVQPLLWFTAGILAIVWLHFVWLSLVVIALVLTVTNTVAFSRCDRFSQANSAVSRALLGGGIAGSLASGVVGRLFGR
ncbi:hypothetical protein FH972_025820 [Carpinus fangiana]|uniref:HpcH/HpaI aldolase/citrate lyase domain-containing protein n=1 Tax=Carpinus fangiana TaxID=176857 RepID=A0A5N6L2J3_9ROSI|nr:hypothetical protein FH972_025820 [Carpinus fangiana]